MHIMMRKEMKLSAPVTTRPVRGRRHEFSYCTTGLYHRLGAAYGGGLEEREATYESRQATY